MKSRRIVRAGLVIGLVVSLTLPLSACSMSPTGYGGDEPVVGSESTDKATLPSSFPAEIPLFSENIAFAGYTESEASWTVLLSTPDLGTDFDLACAQLADAGFTNSFYAQNNDDYLATFENATYKIQLVGRADPAYGPVLDYFVMSLE
jgi:hypothetical protein